MRRKNFRSWRSKETGRFFGWDKIEIMKSESSRELKRIVINMEIGSDGFVYYIIDIQLNIYIIFKLKNLNMYIECIYYVSFVSVTMF